MTTKTTNKKHTHKFKWSDGMSYTTVGDETYILDSSFYPNFEIPYQEWQDKEHKTFSKWLSKCKCGMTEIGTIEMLRRPR